jgi:hypothetical protein
MCAVQTGQAAGNTQPIAFLVFPVYPVFLVYPVFPFVCVALDLNAVFGLNQFFAFCGF